MTGHRRGCRYVNTATVSTTLPGSSNIPGTLRRRGLLSSLGLGLLSGGSRLGSGGGLGLLSSLGGSLRGLGGGGSVGLGLSRGLSDGLLLLVLGLHILSDGRLALLVTAEESTEDRGALLAGGTLALVLLSVSGLLLGLLLGLALSSLSGGGSLSGSRGGGALGSGSLLSSLGGVGLGLLLLLFLLLLLLLDGGGEGSEGGLVLLGLGDGLGELLGLSDPQLDLGDPVVALSGAGGLEGVLVSLRREDELVGALGGGLGSIVLDDESARMVLEHVLGWSTHQCDGAGGRSLVLALLAEEQQTLSGLAGPCGEVVVLQQRGELLGVDGLRAEPEELLRVDEVPVAWLATCLTICLA